MQCTCCCGIWATFHFLFFLHKRLTTISKRLTFSSAGMRVIGLNGVDRSNFDTKAYVAVLFCEVLEAQTNRILLWARFTRLLHCTVLRVLTTVLLSFTGFWGAVRNMMDTKNDAVFSVFHRAYSHIFTYIHIYSHIFTYIHQHMHTF